MRRAARRRIITTTHCNSRSRRPVALTCGHLWLMRTAVSVLPLSLRRRKKGIESKFATHCFLLFPCPRTPLLGIGFTAGSTGNLTGFCAGRSCIVKDFAVRLLLDPVGEYL